MALPANWSMIRLVAFMVDDDGNPATGYTLTVQSSQTRLQDNTSRRVIFPEPDVLTPSITDGYVWVDVVSDTDTDLSPTGRQHKITLKKGPTVVQTWFVSVDHAQATQVRFDNVTQAIVTSGGTQRDAIYLTSLQDFSDAPNVSGGGSGGTVNLTDYFTKTQTTQQVIDGITAHVNAADPHTQYATNDELASGLGGKADTSAVSGKADQSALTAHTGNTSNPHSTTKSQVGLGNVDNTADAAKPISTAAQAALDGLPFRAANVDQTGAAAGGIPTATQVTDPGTPQAKVTQWAVADPPMPALVATLVFGS